MFCEHYESRMIGALPNCVKFSVLCDQNGTT